MPLYNAYTDNQLARLLKTADHAAYNEIYNRYWGILYRHALRMLDDTDLAKDVIQDVFTMLWVKGKELELNTSLSSFLYASVRNRTMNQIDHSKVRDNYISSLETAIEEGEATTDLLLMEKELAKRIEAELSLLPEKMRRVFELSRIHDYSYKQISEELNISDNTVKKQMSNALKILRMKLHLFIWFFCLTCVVSIVVLFRSNPLVLSILQLYL